MSIKIGHASLGETGKISNNKAGDQTGKEVCVRTWYSKPWGFVLRHPDAKIREKMAKACEAGCANAMLGYDQYQRNTAHTEAKKVGYDLSKIKIQCETDCSAFMTLCAIAAGVTKLEYTGNAPTTSTMKTVFKNAGFTVLEDPKYLTSDEYLVRGDILVKAGVHTVMALDNGAKAIKSNTTKVECYKACAVKYTSIVDALDSIKVDSSKINRMNIAKANGISNYSGTSAENTKLLKLLKAGKLKK